MDEIEVRELRYFVAVAQELNFTRAAQRLGIAQPPLSRAIAKLERRMGVQLFQRTNRHVMLTLAGRTLLVEADAALNGMSAAVARTRRAIHPGRGLVVTAKPGNATGLLQRIVRAYEALPETPPVEIVVSGDREQADMVRDGRADLALLCSPYDERGLDTEPLTSEPRVAALPTGHPLARRASLCCRDLAGEPFPEAPRLTPDERAYRTGQDRDPSASARPDTVGRGPTVSDITQALEVVALGQAVALIPRSMSQLTPRPDIAYRPVLDASPYIVAIAWPQGARAQPIAAFVRTAIEAAD